MVGKKNKPKKKTSSKGQNPTAKKGQRRTLESLERKRREPEKKLLLLRGERPHAKKNEKTQCLVGRKNKRWKHILASRRRKKNAGRGKKKELRENKRERMSTPFATNQTSTNL